MAGSSTRSVGYNLTETVRVAILQIPADDWACSLDQDGHTRPNGEVCEITEHLDLTSWPQGTRVIVRRERAHPGAQLSFTDHDGHRFQAILTDQTGPIAKLERDHRGPTRVEDHIRNDKDDWHSTPPPPPGISRPHGPGPANWQPRSRASHGRVIRQRGTHDNNRTPRKRGAYAQPSPRSARRGAGRDDRHRRRCSAALAARASAPSTPEGGYDSDSTTGAARLRRTPRTSSTPTTTAPTSRG
jgi:hypothetical protein